MKDLTKMKTPQGKLYAHQKRLPIYPVPSLQQTCDRYIDSIKPLVSEEQLRKSKALIDEFKIGPGKVLQDRLLAYAKTTKNWLAENWENCAYMGYRDSVVLNSNYFFGFLK